MHCAKPGIWNKLEKSAASGLEMERVMGIEPTLFAWEAKVLPLNYTRLGACSALALLAQRP